MIWPRRIRSLLRRGELEWAIKESKVEIPEDRTPFQQARLIRCLGVVSDYLKTSKTTQEIGEEMNLTHQRVVQLLQFGLGYLMDKQYIRTPLAEDPPSSSAKVLGSPRKSQERSMS